MKDNVLRFSATGIMLGLGIAMVTGCGHSPMAAGMPPPAPPEVQVSLPVMGEVIDFEDFPGRIVAINSVEVRARVTGHLDQIHFREGSDIQKGDLLFEIDPRAYEAELARAEGNLLQTEGRLKRLEGEYDRSKTLFGKGVTSREDFARVTADLTEAKGALMVNRAARDLAALNVGFTKVQAPLNGRISSRSIDPGNIVKADETTVTSIVSLDPIYAQFDLDERSLLRLKRLIREHKITWSIDGGLPVQLGMADETGFPHQGVINFAENRVDADTGTWRLRGQFENPEFMFSPGLFVRIRLPLGTPYQALLMSEEALGTDQGQKYLYVVDKAGKVEYRRVKIGKLQAGLRVITEGLAADETVVVSGLQRVRQGVEVKPELVPLAHAGGQPAAETPKTPAEDAKESPTE